ncbi:hypothetical protein F0562_009028 [Nyssa sinensis]|uniref:Uncharacterized protein n=1 Tax=Nyssa sinensis TaxID=561372 RepID=A0A5J5A940_9ASTE|nr:hypothetical protein F0562_009028 [Nyssa sinensis]
MKGSSRWFTIGLVSAWVRYACDVDGSCWGREGFDDDPSKSVCSEPSSVQHDRIIIVANQLPIRVQRKPDNSKGWTFNWDKNSLLLQLKDGLGDDEIDVIYVGCLKEEIHPNEQDEVSQILLETFKCVPTFLPSDLFGRYYHGFCKQQLWPLFHYMLPLSLDLGGRFNHSLCRMLGLSYESKRGYIGLEYYGRTVSIKILPVGIHMGQLQSVLSLSKTEAKVAELIKQFCDQGKILLLGVDDMDIFKGISLKLLGRMHGLEGFEV